MAETNNALALSGDQQVVLKEMKHNRNLLVAFTKEVLKKDVDFGEIPGVKKPSLLKPGAEKLQSLFKLSAEFTCTERVVDLANKFLSFSYMCTIRNIDGRILSQCEGNVNSYETKYRYNWVTATKPDDTTQARMKAEGTGKFAKGQNGWEWKERRENPDVIGLQNTLMKMSQKRALVGSILIATGASEFYTQDVEDMGFIDVEVADVDSGDGFQEAEVVETKVNTPEGAQPEVKKQPAKKKADAAQPEPAKENKAVAEPTIDQRVNNMLRKPTESEKAQGGEVMEVPQDAFNAIAAASTKDELIQIYNQCSALHNNVSFMQALTKRKREVAA
jgi:hypothetical protein